MKISELSRISGVSVSRIRYYVAKGILPEPSKISKTRAFYGPEHLKRLELFKKIGKKKRVVNIIKDLLDIDPSNDAEAGHPDKLQIARTRIINASIPVFRKYGYEGATIGDIAKAARINRNTIYKYFKDKEDLFIHCINEIVIDFRHNLPEDLQLLSETKDTEMVKERLNKVATAFRKIYPEWADMMNLLRAAAVKEPGIFAKMLDDAYSIRIKPVAADLEKLIKHKVFRNVDPFLTAIIAAGAMEYTNYFISRGKFNNNSARFEADAIDILLYGLIRRF
ncbi:MAG: TetR family transcriptional regulator [Dehalococcoidia bacterium]|nr:TetR family transcriptional regulator [Dehalococcoidia bacterium]